MKALHIPHNDTVIKGSVYQDKPHKTDNSQDHTYEQPVAWVKLAGHASPKKKEKK
jgi:hypothetical protein